MLFKIDYIYKGKKTIITYYFYKASKNTTKQKMEERE